MSRPCRVASEMERGLSLGAAGGCPIPILFAQAECRDDRTMGERRGVPKSPHSPLARAAKECRSDPGKHDLGFLESRRACHCHMACSLGFHAPQRQGGNWTCSQAREDQFLSERCMLLASSSQGKPLHSRDIQKQREWWQWCFFSPLRRCLDRSGPTLHNTAKRGGCERETGSILAKRSRGRGPGQTDTPRRGGETKRRESMTPSAYPSCLVPLQIFREG